MFSDPSSLSITTRAFDSSSLRILRVNNMHIQCQNLDQ
jgi:hypothetical protein